MIALTIAALLVPPLVTLRGRTLAAWFACDLTTWLLAWLVWLRVSSIEPRVALTALVVLKLCAFLLFLANGSDVRWSANRAAIIAAVIYAATIPVMLHAPIDGDEPWYLLTTESVVHDFDLDLANQYRALERSATRRSDLAPLPGDPVGAEGEQYSRHEPLLSLLMAPGFFIAGLPGALATIALFGALLVRTTVRWMEDEEIEAATVRAVFPFFALAPPLLFYATRIWPEVPAAFFFVEALRGMRERRAKRWIPALAGLVLLKLRFVLVALALLTLLLADGKGRAAGRRPALAALLMALLLLPLAVMWTISGNPVNVHSWRELLPGAPLDYARGLGGLIADGMSGLAFQAPFYLLGVAMLFRWRSAPRGFRMGVLASSLYLFYLLPRGEWFGGWAPPLRYLVFLMPILALGAAAVWERVPRGVVALLSAWTAGLVIHGLAWPWRLFHLFNGENAAGEWLSRVHSADFSRLFPSFIRLNAAAWPGVAAVVLLLGWIALRRPEGARSPARVALQLSIAALAVAAGAVAALQPASRVDFEDAHVTHDGGALYPETYTMMRTAYRGGWVLSQGHSMSFLAREGTWALHFITGLGATVEIGGEAHPVRADEAYQSVRVRVPRSGRVVLRCISGEINVDRMERLDE